MVDLDFVVPLGLQKGLTAAGELPKFIITHPRVREKMRHPVLCGRGRGLSCTFFSGGQRGAAPDPLLDPHLVIVQFKSIPPKMIMNLNITVFMHNLKMYFNLN